MRFKRLFLPILSAIMLLTLVGGILNTTQVEATLTQPTSSRGATAATYTVVFTPTKDNTLFEDDNGTLSNGAGQHLFVGTTAQAEKRLRRALLAFDVAGRLPAGATVVSATLIMNMSQTISGDQPVSLHTATADWGEGTSVSTMSQEGNGGPATAGDATWIHAFYSTTTWSTAGGDFTALASATETVGGGGTYSWTSAQVVTDVQNWVDTPGTNFGWIMLGNETTNPTAKRFDSRQNSSPKNRPQLVIEFMPEATAPTSITVTGPLTAEINTSQAFTAVVSPDFPSLPFTYTWAATDQAPLVEAAESASHSVAFTWAMTGTKTVTVTAANSEGVVIDTWELVVASPTQPLTPTQQIALTPNLDNTLYEDSQGGLSNGQGDYLFVGVTQGAAVRRALIAFDVAGQIPAGSQVLSATLEMYMDRTLANQGNENTIRLQRVTQGWGEGTSNASGQEGAGTSATVGDATWLHALYDTDLWQTPGGSFEPAVSAMTSVNLQGAYLWGSTPKMVSDIQSWLELPSQNYGWILVGNESSLPTAKRFRSRHYPDAAFRPMLIITYVEGELPYALYLPAATAE